MQYVIINKYGMVEMTGISKELYRQAIEAPNDIIFGDHYINGEWVRDGERIKLRSEEIRKTLYEGEEIIEWEGKFITVDEAIRIYYYYFVEDNTKADQIKPLIVSAKAGIRSKYTDN